MKNIVIFAGGHGAIKLQNSIHYYGNNDVHVDIVISGYDNAKSTLACRQVFNNDILGVSDVRKNQITQFKLQKNIEDIINKSMLDYLEYRLPNTKEINYKKAYDLVKEGSLIANGFKSGLIQSKKSFYSKLYDKAMYNFFHIKTGEWRETVKNINFADFSVANILYASIANMFGNSLDKSATIMANCLNIEDNVRLISDVNLYLNGLSKEGNVLNDEDIMSNWKNEKDPIVDLFFTDKFGFIRVPFVDESNDGINKYKGKPIENMIANADIIIFSSGSQWTSLIPTYAHLGLNNMIKKSKAKKYIVMNNIEDRDLFGVNSTGILKVVNKYISLNEFTVIYNENAIPSLQYINDGPAKNHIIAKLSDKPGSQYHNEEIFKYVLLDYYKDFLNADNYVFDFDDTIMCDYRKYNSFNKCKANMELVASLGCKKIILSGNDISRFYKLIPDFSNTILKNVFSNFYCNFGNSKYKYDESSEKFYCDSKITTEYNIYCYKELVAFIKYEFEDISALDDNGFYEDVKDASFDLRGDVNIAIHPVKNREYVIKEVNHILDVFNTLCNTNFIATINGHTTIDIFDKNYNKAVMMMKITENSKSTVYIGDKFEDGNDKCIKQLTNVRCMSVNDINDTNLFLKTLTGIWYISEND